MARGAKTGGRQKGTPNRITGDLRAMVEGALSDVGGQAYLAEQARENPAAFLNLVGKCMPKDIQVDVSETLAELISKAVSG